MAYEVVCDHWEFMGPTYKKVVGVYETEDAAEAAKNQLNANDPLVLDHDCGDDYDRCYIVRKA